MTPSVGNFVLIHFPDDTTHSAEAADAFLTQRGYILRRVSGYGFPNALRMTVGTEDANRGVVAALAEFLAQLTMPEPLFDKDRPRRHRPHRLVARPCRRAARSSPAISRFRRAAQRR